jgi:PAS domain S-box-containing protein
MTPKVVETQVRDAADRVASLRARAEQTSVDDQSEVLKEGLEELGVAFEELHFAQEELRVQNEKLEESKLALAVERDRYRDLLQFAGVAYIVTDSEGIIRQANHAAGELLQIVPRYLRGKPLTVYVEPEDRSHFLNDLTAAQKGEPMPTRVLRMQPRPEGSDFRVTTAVVVPYKDPEAAGTFLRWQFVDTTEHWRTAQEMRRLNDDLETRVRVRTERLERALREKEAAERDMASAARRKDEFLAVLGHELRGPLSAIRNAAELIRATLPAESKLLPSAAVVERQARRMSRQMDDLLDVARIAQGKVQFRPTSINIGTRPVIDGLA